MGAALDAMRIPQSPAAEAQSSSRPRVAYFDVLNVLACCAVVIMHVGLAYWDFRPRPSWILNCVGQKSFEWAVGVFYMLTGATLIGFTGRMSGAEYAKRRVLKTVLPLIVWSFIAILFDVYYTGLLDKGLSCIDYFNIALLNNIPSATVYWFFFPLFTIYLFIPLLSVIPEGRRVGVFVYVIAVALLITTIGEVLPYVGIDYNSDLQAPVPSGWCVYPLMGYVLSRVELKPWQKNAIYTAGVIGFLLMLFGTLIFSMEENTLVHAFSGGASLPKFFQASAVFLLAKQLAKRKPSIARWGGVAQARPADVWRLPDALFRYQAVPVWVFHQLEQLVVAACGHASRPRGELWSLVAAQQGSCA